MAGHAAQRFTAVLLEIQPQPVQHRQYFRFLAVFQMQKEPGNAVLVFIHLYAHFYQKGEHGQVLFPQGCEKNFI